MNNLPDLGRYNCRLKVVEFLAQAGLDQYVHDPQFA
jgi:hypothetical protein